MFLCSEFIFVDPDNDILALVDTRLTCRSRLFNQALGHAGCHGFGHAAQCIYLADDFPRLIDQFCGQCLDIIGTAQRIDDLRNSAFFRQNDLRVAGNPRRKVSRQCYGFIKRIGVQGLRSTQGRGHRFDRGADNIVIGVLLLQRHARCLAMGAQHFGALIFGTKTIHDAMPERTCGTQLRHFHEEVHADAEEEGKPTGKGIDVQAACHGTLHIFLAVCDGERQFLHRRRAGFMHMVAGNRNAVKLRHIRAGIGDDVRNDPHRRFGRIDVGVADHELFQNIVLNGPVQLRL